MVRWGRFLVVFAFVIGVGGLAPPAHAATRTVRTTALLTVNGGPDGSSSLEGPILGPALAGGTATFVHFRQIYSSGQYVLAGPKNHARIWGDVAWSGAANAELTVIGGTDQFSGATGTGTLTCAGDGLAAYTCTVTLQIQR